MFVSRSWQGLDPQLGRTAVDSAVHGSMGLAMHYSHEPRDTELQQTVTADDADTALHC